jgi:sensor histidine kinase YesM
MKRLKKVPWRFVWAQFFAVVLWFFITTIEWSQNPKTNPGFMIPAIIRGTEALSVFLVSGFFIWALEVLPHSIRKPWVSVIMLLLLYPGAIVANLLSLGIRSVLGYSPPPLERYFFFHSLHFYLPMLLVMVIYASVRNLKEMNLERENKLKAESLAQQARWMMLRYQVNPHFLFNALNSIRALIGNDDNKARSAVTELSEYFRYSLTSDNEAMVSLEDEISAVSSSLEIQKIRFSSRLNPRMEVDPETLSCAVPVFAIQTLVENGIKYGLKTTDGVLQLIVRTAIRDQCLHISVINTGKLISIDHSIEKCESSGTGLENLKERLSYLDPESRFSLHEESGQVIAQLYLTVKHLKNEDMEGADR